MCICMCIMHYVRQNRKKIDDFLYKCCTKNTPFSLICTICNCDPKNYDPNDSQSEVIQSFGLDQITGSFLTLVISIINIKLHFAA